MNDLIQKGLGECLSNSLREPIPYPLEVFGKIYGKLIIIDPKSAWVDEL